MALRSLVAVMWKALPRRMPGSGAFAPKGNPWSKSSAKLTGPTKYGSVEESNLLKTQFEQRLKRSDELQQKYERASDLKILLFGVGSIGYLGFAVEVAPSQLPSILIRRRRALLMVLDTIAEDENEAAAVELSSYALLRAMEVGKSSVHGERFPVAGNPLPHAGELAVVA